MNHFLGKKFFFNLGRDKFYHFYNGYVAYVRVNLGKGAFRLGEDYDVKDDPFGYKEGH